jgi:transcriptional regulator with XRE-family HTH domain
MTDKDDALLDELNYEIGHRIRVFRDAINLPREKFASFTNTTANNVANYENGRQRIPATYLNVLFKRWPHFAMWFLTGLSTEDLPEQRRPDFTKALHHDPGQYI